MLDPRLAHQSLSRALSGDEIALARAMEEIFAAGTHAFDDVATSLQHKGVRRPSGSQEAWSAASLENELAAINASLDAAYAKNGIGA